MRTIETALWPLEKPSDALGLGVFLGEERAPSLAGLAEGERVLLVEPNELRVEAVAHKITLHGQTWWFGEIGDPNAIQVIYTDPVATERQ